MTQPSPKASTSAKAAADRSAGQAGPRVWIALLAVAVLLVGSLQLTRAGYSPDEEFTVFAVNGIAADGLPTLPSGLLYDRGVAYSYASWLARAVSGAQLPAYRALSLLSSVAALAIVFALVRRLSSPTSALVASLLVATSIPFWAAATTARFYAPFFLFYLSALLALCTLRLAEGSGSKPSARSGQAFGTNPLGTLGTVRTLGTIAVVSALCRWTHELAFTLLAVPALGVMLAPRGEKRLWWRAGAAVAVGLAGAQAWLFALHYLAPSSGATMIRRFFLWQVVNLFETPADRQYGIVLAVMVIGWLLAPRRAWTISVIALSGVSLVLAYSIARACNTAPISRELVAAVMSEGARYPLDMFWHIARAHPVTMFVAVGLMIARLAGVGGEWRLAERAIHLLWIGWVLWFGVVESGITINYPLVPVSVMLVAIAVDLVAALGSDPEQAVPRGLHPATQSPRGGGPGLTPSRLAVALVVLAIIGDQWRGEGSPAARLAAARPTITAPGLAEIRNGLRPTDRIACTDELGCLMLVGRIDVWLALDDYVRERFLVRSADEAVVGVYTGVPAVLRPADLFSPGRDGTLADRTLIVDVFKDYPIGSSRTWLPRAIEADGLEVRPLLETPQLRVLQVSPPVGHAARQP
ncbi:MAG: glycosyltransferase family 39 protein [Acidobacteriota bacterium]|nr:glycosyltransferase family 39 protein [Acidobacteriota bacterium]